MFREYFFSWLKNLADLCHENNVHLHLHSHGHIGDLMDAIIEAGVDMVNPIGPSDNNDLSLFKQKWGDKITLHGGISTTIKDMNEEQMREHIHQVVSVGSQGGRFFPRTESGVPPMSLERTKLYIDILHEECQRGYK
jgi:uroporphyrinogen-III decarboxylase